MQFVYAKSYNTIGPFLILLSTLKALNNISLKTWTRSATARWRLCWITINSFLLFLFLYLVLHSLSWRYVQHVYSSFCLRQRRSFDRTSFLSRGCSLSTIHLAIEFEYTQSRRDRISGSYLGAHAVPQRRQLTSCALLHSVGRFPL